MVEEWIKSLFSAHYWYRLEVSLRLYHIRWLKQILCQ
jgi:hypothetical protein